MNNFIKKKDFDFVFPDFEVFETIKKKKYIKSQKSNIFLNLIFYPHGSGCIFKKNIWKKVGGYNEKNYYQDDYDFWLKINKIKDIKIGHLQKPIYIYKKHKNNMSLTNFKTQIEQMILWNANLKKENNFTNDQITKLKKHIDRMVIKFDNKLKYIDN